MSQLALQFIRLFRGRVSIIFSMASLKLSKTSLCITVYFPNGSFFNNTFVPSSFDIEKSPTITVTGFFRQTTECMRSGHFLGIVHYFQRSRI